MKTNIAWVLLLVGAVFFVRETWPKTVVETEVVTLPAVPETIRVELPGETDTIFVVKRDTINSVVTRTVYDTVWTACSELDPRRRIVAGVLGRSVGDTTRVVSELLWGDSLGVGTQQTTEKIYNRGMVSRIGVDLEGVTIDFVPFPVERIRECSLWQKIPPALMGAGAGMIIGKVF